MGRKKSGQVKTGRRHGFEDLDRAIEFQLEFPDIAPERVVTIEPEVLKKILTPGRLELIKTIRKRKPENITELCRLVKRSKESVSRDLKVLENYGILDMIEQGRTKKPVQIKEALMVRI